MTVEHLEVLDVVQPNGWTRCATFSVSVSGLDLRYWTLMARGESFSVSPPRTKVGGEIVWAVKWESIEAKARILVAALRAYIAAGGKLATEARACLEKTLDLFPDVSMAYWVREHGYGDEVARTFDLIDRGELPMPRPRPAREAQ